MRKRLIALTGGILAIVLFSAVLWSMWKVEVDDPHLPMLNRENCLRCHDTDGEGQVNGEEFVDAIIGFCHDCHPPDKMGRSHPVNVDLKRTFRFPDMDVPDELSVGGQWDDLLTCATCHRIHGPWKSRVKAYSTQKPLLNQDASSHFYSTFYLRIPGDPKSGWANLCDACHAGYL